MQLTPTILRNIADAFSYKPHNYPSWYAFIESIGIMEHIDTAEHGGYNKRLLSISDPHLFTLACIRYGF
jgi:hypothetical protein